MAVLAYTIGFSLLMWMNTEEFRLIKYTLRSQKTQLSFWASPILVAADTAEIPAWQSDGQMAFRLYIVDNNII